MKNWQVVLFTSVLAAGSASAMTFKDVAPVRHPLFVSAEGNYTTNSFNSVNVRNVSLPRSTNYWGARLAAGAIHYATNEISYTGEVGWGYYGQTSFKSNTMGVNATGNIYGMDLLVGVDYLYNSFDFFAKVGGMGQNVKMQRKTDLSKFVSGGSMTGITRSTVTVSTVVPEIKVGGTYNFNEEVGLTFAYMHTFGTNVNMNYAPAFDGTTVTMRNSTNAPPLSLNSLSLGVVYKFA